MRRLRRPCARLTGMEAGRPLWETVWRLLKEPDAESPQDPASPPRRRVHTPCSQQSARGTDRSPPTGERANKCGLYGGCDDPAVTWKGVLTDVTTRTSPGDAMRRGQPQKDEPGT